MNAPARLSLRPLLLWLLMLCVFAGAAFSRIARAQTPTPTPKGPLQMTLSSPLALKAAPLAITTKAGRWFPVAVTLANSGPAVNGEVRLRLVNSGGFEVAPNDFYSTVDLPTNANKVVWLYGRMERPGITGCEITFSGRGFAPIKQNVGIAPLDDEQRLVVTVADSDDGLQGALQSLRANGLFRGGKRPQFNPNLQPVRALQATSANVPDRWIGFDGADMLVLGDFVHTSLAPKQLEALKGWVQGGGNMVVVGGNNAGRLNTSPLRELWPLVPTSSAPASANEVQNLVTNYVPNPKNGADRLGGAPVVVLRGPLDAGAALKVGQPNAPLLAVSERGAGRVMELSFNPGQPPFVGWSGQGKLWGEVFNSAVDVRRIETGDPAFVSYGGMGINPNSPAYSGGYNGGYDNMPVSATGQMLRGLSKVKQLTMPPVSQIAWFLALYVFFLVPVNYAVLRLIDRRELAWVTIPVIVVAFSVFAYSAALSIRGKAILTRQVDIAQSSIGSNTARTDSLLWLFSPKRTSYTLTAGGQGAVVADYANEAGAKQGAFSVVEPGDGASFEAQNANVWMWTDRTFSAQSLGDLGKGVTLNGDALVNNTPLDLRGAVWVSGGRVWSLGDIKVGASAKVSGEGTATSGADLPGAIATAAGLDKIFDSSTLSNGIPNSAMQLALGNDLGKYNDAPMLIAWGKTPLSPIKIGDARADNITLMIFRAPASKLSGALASRSATIKPVSFVPLDPNNNVATQVGQESQQGGGYQIYDATLPAGDSLILKARGLGIGPQNNGFNPNAPAPGAPAGSPPAGGPPGSRPTPTATPSPKMKRKPITWIRFEVLDARSGKWQPLEGEMKRDNSPARGWNFRARINPNMARTPDRLLRVRARLANQQAKVTGLNIGQAELR